MNDLTSIWPPEEIRTLGATVDRTFVAAVELSGIGSSPSSSVDHDVEALARDTVELRQGLDDLDGAVPIPNSATYDDLSTVAAQTAALHQTCEHLETMLRGPRFELLISRLLRSNASTARALAKIRRQTAPALTRALQELSMFGERLEERCHAIQAVEREKDAEWVPAETVYEEMGR